MIRQHNLNHFKMKHKKLQKTRLMKIKKDYFQQRGYKYKVDRQIILGVTIAPL